MPNNVRISLKTDLLSNWNNSNIILNVGEFALVQMPNNTIKIKIGNGTDLVSALPYINETEFFTNSLSTVQSNIGQFNSTTTYSLVAGLHVSAEAIDSNVFGYNAKTLSTDQRAFVWNGKNLYGVANTYKSHGQGTFSLNPENGISGIYIGEETLAEILNNKIYINGEQTTSLSILNISQDDYYNLVNSENGPDKNTLYIVSSDNLNLYGEKIINVLSGTEETDAATVGQINKLSNDLISEINKIEIPVNVSQLSNDSGFITAKVNDNQVSSLEVKNINQKEYHQLVIDNNVDSNTVYIVSSDTLNMYGEQIKNVADATEEKDAVNLKQLTKYISDFQIIRPNFVQKALKLRVVMYSNAEMTEEVGHIDSSADYMSAFRNTPDNLSWQNFGEDGLPASYSNCPVLVKLSNWLTDNNLAYSFERLYISYTWYYNDDNGVEHISDSYSIVVPSYTEVGANSSDYVTKEQYEELNSKIRKDTYTSELQDDMYMCYADKTNVIQGELTGEVEVILNDFSKNNQYDIKFKTGSSSVNFKFYSYSEINGAVLGDWNINTNTNYVFPENSEFLIKIRQDMIEVVGDNFASSSSLGYKLITAEPIGEYPNVTYTIENQTITTINLDDENLNVTIQLPENKNNGYARDFILRLNITEMPEIIWSGIDESWDVESDDVDWLNLEIGSNVISFTELA